MQKPRLSAKEHRERHALLHAMLDELVACYLLEHRGALPSKITVLELMKWSFQRTQGNK
jgi:hypothetical protein